MVYLLLVGLAAGIINMFLQARKRWQSRFHFSISNFDVPKGVVVNFSFPINFSNSVLLFFSNRFSLCTACFIRTGNLIFKGTDLILSQAFTFFIPKSTQLFCLLFLGFKRFFLLIIILEILYGGLIYSKYIIFTNLLFLSLFTLAKTNSFKHKLIFGAFVILENFIRINKGNIRNMEEWRRVIIITMDWIAQRFPRSNQAFPFSMQIRFFTEPLNGASFCKINGYWYQDALIKLPHICINLDEPEFVFFLKSSDRRIIDKISLHFGLNHMQILASMEFWIILLISFYLSKVPVRRWLAKTSLLLGLFSTVFKFPFHIQLQL